MRYLLPVLFFSCVGNVIDDPNPPSPEQGTGGGDTGGGVATAGGSGGSGGSGAGTAGGSVAGGAGGSGGSAGGTVAYCMGEATDYMPKGMAQLMSLCARGNQD